MPGFLRRVEQLEQRLGGADDGPCPACRVAIGAAHPRELDWLEPLARCERPGGCPYRIRRMVAVEPIGADWPADLSQPLS
jgi:hypothetical protein